MRGKRILISFIVVIAIFLCGTLGFSLLRDDDRYKYFTGLGSSFDISPDDTQYVFSYYLDGSEAIFITDIDGKKVKRMTNSETERHHSPKYSRDGAKILFLSKNQKGINSLYVANTDGSNQKKLTSKKIHVSNAVFSSDGELIYYVGMPAKDFLKDEGETKEGLDLFSIEISGGQIRQLTDKDYFNMDSLSLSPDGKELYYSLFDGSRERITSFSLHNRGEKDATFSRLLPQDGYTFQLSADGSKFAYTAISKESKDTSLYKYELFLSNLEKGNTKRLTNLDSSIESPRFFHDGSQMAFLENSNWPNEPAKYKFYTLDLNTESVQELPLDLPTNNGSSHWFMQWVDQLVNRVTIISLYIVFFGSLVTYQYYFSEKRRTYFPAIISLYLSVAVIISSIVAAFVFNPWIGIALGMVAVALFGSTITVFAYAFVLGLIRKRT